MFSHSTTVIWNLLRIKGAASPLLLRYLFCTFLLKTTTHKHRIFLFQPCNAITSRFDALLFGRREQRFSVITNWAGMFLDYNSNTVVRFTGARLHAGPYITVRCFLIAIRTFSFPATAFLWWKLMRDMSGLARLIFHCFFQRFVERDNINIHWPCDNVLSPFSSFASIIL